MPLVLAMNKPFYRVVALGVVRLVRSFVVYAVWIRGCLARHALVQFGVMRVRRWL